MATNVINVATVINRAAVRRFRLLQRQIRSARDVRRARIGFSSQKRWRSAASSAAEAYRTLGSFSVALRTMVSRSRGMAESNGTWRFGLVLDDAAQQDFPVGVREDGLPRQEFVERNSQRIDVGPIIRLGPITRRLFGAHVAERAQDIARHREAGIGMRGGQAEVGDPEMAVRIHQQVRRLDVAVHDAHLVCVVESFGRLDAQPGDLAEPLAGIDCAQR